MFQKFQGHLAGGSLLAKAFDLLIQRRRVASGFSQQKRRDTGRVALQLFNGGVLAAEAIRNGGACERSEQ